MNYTVNASGRFANQSALPLVRWADELDISFTLPQGTVQEGDTFALAIDTDRFLHNGLCALSESFTVSGDTVSFTAVNTTTRKFLDAVNGKAGNIAAWMQLTRYIGGDIERRQTVLDDRCALQGVVYIKGASADILDPNASYTKEEMDAIVEGMEEAKTAAELAAEAAGRSAQSVSGVEQTVSGYLVTATALNEALENYDGDNTGY